MCIYIYIYIYILYAYIYIYICMKCDHVKVCRSHDVMSL